jgi:hypothetical protein
MLRAGEPSECFTCGTLGSAAAPAKAVFLLHWRQCPSPVRQADTSPWGRVGARGRRRHVFFCGGTAAWGYFARSARQLLTSPGLFVAV